GDTPCGSHRDSRSSRHPRCRTATRPFADCSDAVAETRPREHHAIDAAERYETDPERASALRGAWFRTHFALQEDSAVTHANAQLGLGLAALGRPGYITLGHGEDLGGETSVAAMERHCHVMLDAAWTAGVRWFDAARSYGRAEQFLASWLA